MAGACVIQIALDNWLSSARLPAALRAAGLEVIALCGPESPLQLTRHISSHVILGEASDFISQLERVVERHDPVALIPSDERSLRRLHAIATAGLCSPRLLELLRRSLGRPEGYATLTSKWATGELAQRLHIPVPRQERARTAAEAVAFARSIGFPIILKRENTYGGMGCIVCRSEAQIRLAVTKLRVKRFYDRFGWTARAESSRARHTQEAIIVQRFHEGPLAFSACLAVDGKLVGGLTVVAEQVNPTPTGASTVIRALDRPDMLAISSKLIEATGCSGFVGVDFILDKKTGQPYLLEINARVTPLCHVAGLLGTDLCAAFAESFAGIETGIQSRQKIERVAFFPDEWSRDPLSPYLKTAHHDIPIDDEALVAYAHRRLRRRRRLSRCFSLSFHRTRAVHAEETASPLALGRRSSDCKSLEHRESLRDTGPSL